VDLEVRSVSKRFGATIALDNVNLKIASGTIHSLIGENGAGKSTLGKILSGVYQLDSGEVELAGQAVIIGSPREALSRGITIIAQELSLVPSRTAADNVYLGIEDHAGPWVRRTVIKERFEELMKSSGIAVPNDRPIAELSIGDQQKVEILRALARNAEVIVMDEPTARLSVEETGVLKSVMRSLRDQGKTIIFVSHFLGDVLDVSDAITIMRDGKIIRTSKPTEETHDSLVEAMTGRKAGDAFPAKKPPLAPVSVLEVTGLTRGALFSDISFTVGAGEIVALAGLVGSGRSEVARAIYGADPIDSGEVKLQGNTIKISHPATAISNGIAMIPESRKDQGLILDRPIRENIALPYLKKLSSVLMKRRQENSLVSENFQAAGIRALSSEMSVRSLSGGNQQKVLFARSLAGAPTLFIADEPTRGVDVGSKRAIYELMVDLASKGMAVLVISSELDEVVGLAHRVIVMQTGKIVAELVGDQISESAVVAAAFSTKQREGLAS